MQQEIEQALHQALALHRAGQLAEAEQLYKQVLAADRANFPAYYLAGILCFQQGRNEEARALFGEALRHKPEDPQTLLHLGLTLQAMGRLGEAMPVVERLLAIEPGNVEGLTLKANAFLAVKRGAEALATYDQALVGMPNDVVLLNNRGNALRQLKRFEEALASYDAALAVQPDFADALNNRGTALRDLGRREEALATYDAALALRPDLAEIHCFRGRLLFDLERYDDALAGFDRALALKPDFADALDNRGTVLRRLGRREEALECFSRALDLKPNDADLIASGGGVLLELARYGEALNTFEAVLAIVPGNADALNHRGIALQELGRFEEALASFNAALMQNPDDIAAYNNRGFILLTLARPREAIASFEAALARDSDDAALSGLGMAVLSACAWDRVPALREQLRRRVIAGKPVLPFVLIGFGFDPELLHDGARVWAQSVVPVPARWNGAAHEHAKIRIAYLSADFHEHATAYLMAGLFEAHDRERFEIHALSWGPDDQSPMRLRLVKAFDHFHDARGHSDEEIARMMREAQIDIAVDLKGYTQGCRPHIFGLRPCAVQVNYLGFPGTMGADFIDYILADSTVAPFEQQQFFHEKIVHLEPCYQVNDAWRAADLVTPSRTELGLPEDALVLCCFNNSWKITEQIFAVWMRVLEAAPGAVLWLLEDSVDARRALKTAASALGIDPARLVFAKRVPLAEHLARQRVADLFVDTLPYNAHTTASDALWMGVPLVTCQGENFAGRVAASLLGAVGLDELVTGSLEAYEAIILRLVRDPKILAKARVMLEEGRSSAVLFDTARFARTIEAAYERMHQMAESGKPPQSFSV